MAKVINHLGSIFNKDQFAKCYAADDIDEHGREFIKNMHYFLETAHPRNLESDPTWDAYENFNQTRTHKRTPKDEEE